MVNGGRTDPHTDPSDTDPSDTDPHHISFDRGVLRVHPQDADAPIPKAMDPARFAARSAPPTKRWKLPSFRSDAPPLPGDATPARAAAPAASMDRLRSSQDRRPSPFRPSPGFAPRSAAGATLNVAPKDRTVPPRGDGFALMKPPGPEAVARGRAMGGAGAAALASSPPRGVFITPWKPPLLSVLSGLGAIHGRSAARVPASRPPTPRPWLRGRDTSTIPRRGSPAVNVSPFFEG